VVVVEASDVDVAARVVVEVLVSGRVVVVVVLVRVVDGPLVAVSSSVDPPPQAATTTAAAQTSIDALIAMAAIAAINRRYATLVGPAESRHC